MKTVFKNTASIVLAVLFLFTSLGFSLKKMECLMSGKVAYGLNSVESCCPSPEPGQSSMTSRCCVVTSVDLQLDVSKVKVPSEAWISLVVAPLETPAPSVSAIVVEDREVLHFADPSPPDDGWTILLRKQSFLL